MTRGRWSLVASSILLGLATAWLTWAAGLTFWVGAPTVAGWRPYVVLTNSMRPGLAPGDVVLISHDTAADERPLAANEVALVADKSRSEGTRLHRFVRTEADGRVVTKGDANRDEDSPTPADTVLGRGRLIVPSVGLPLIWLRHHTYLPLALVVMITWAAVFILINRRRRAGDPEDDGHPRRGRRRAEGGTARRGRTGRSSSGRARSGRGTGAHAAPPRRTRRRAVAVASTVAVTGAAVLQTGLPAWAAFSSTRSNSGSVVTAGRWTTPPDGPTHWWRLGEAATVADDTNAPDQLSGAPGAVTGKYDNGHGSMTGAILNSADKAATFNGTNQCVNLGDFFSFENTTKFSFELWFYRTAEEDNIAARLFSKVGAGENWELAVNPKTNGNAGQLYFRRGTGVFVGSNGPANATALNTWYHVAVTYDGTTLSYYQDGALKSTAATTLALTNTADPAYLGCRSTGGGAHLDHFTGAIDEVLLYDTALTASQVTAHYLSGRGGLP